jgi:uncharacterized protein YqcC (DUF446 family)
VKNTTWLQFVCVPLLENLCAKSVKRPNDVAVVAELLNCIKSKVLNHYQFTILIDMDSENGDVLYCTEVA